MWTTRSAVSRIWQHVGDVSLVLIDNGVPTVTIDAQRQRFERNRDWSDWEPAEQPQVELTITASLMEIHVATAADLPPSETTASSAVAMIPGFVASRSPKQETAACLS